MRSAKVTRESITQAAWELVKNRGIEHLTSRDVARCLKIKAPSLYNHIRSFTELRVLISVRVNVEMAEVIKKAVGRKVGRAAVMALAKAYRAYALGCPSLYQLSAAYPSCESTEFFASYARLRDEFIRVLRSEYPFSDKQAWLAARTLRSFLHGFISLEINKGWSLSLDVEKSFKEGLALTITAIEASSRKKSIASGNC